MRIDTRFSDTTEQEVESAYLAMGKNDQLAFAKKLFYMFCGLLDSQNEVLGDMLEHANRDASASAAIFPHLQKLLGEVKNLESPLREVARLMEAKQDESAE